MHDGQKMFSQKNSNIDWGQQCNEENGLMNSLSVASYAAKVCQKDTGHSSDLDLKINVTVR